MSRIIVGDNRAVLPLLPADSFDSIVTDPPYELGFMGKRWDQSGIALDPAVWNGVFRVLKPGSYLLAFGGTRTNHRMVCAIEDAGFEIHDCLSWLYGSGFPKHKSKLKPAWEPVCVARKPGKSATPLQIDACRINPGEEVPGGGGLRGGATSRHEGYQRPSHLNAAATEPHTLGRWPANVVIDEEAASMVDAQSGNRPSSSGTRPRGTNNNVYGKHTNTPFESYGDSGGASRFYYCAKASRAEREFGLEALARSPINWSSGTHNPGSFQSEGTDKTSSNPHPTVKPLALMRWLVRLVTPRGGAVLDPFAGSGTTGLACIHERFDCTLIEKEIEFAHIIKGRCDALEPGAFTLEHLEAA